MVLFQSIKKYYGDRLVLDIPHLSLAAGAMHIVIGPNGSGKTTLLRLIMGLEKPDSGAIEWKVRAPDMGYCFQKPFMFAGSVRKNVAFGLATNRNIRDEDSLEALMRQYGIAHLAGREAKRLSAGEMQRVALARTMARKPRLLLLDEPLANLEPDSVEAVEGLLRQMAADSTTIIMTTHLVGRAADLGGRILRLESGRLGPGEIQNVYRGHLVEAGDEIEFHLSAGPKMKVATTIRGAARIAISPHDVVLSTGPLDSSMRNSFQGTVAVLRGINGLVCATVDIGCKLESHITHASARDLGLSVGSTVFASFKASAVKVFQ